MTTTTRAECAGGASCVSSQRERADIDVFLAKIDCGVGIEELILQDARNQRRAGNAIRKIQREHRRVLVAEVARKIKEAANMKFWSALTGSLVKVGFSAVGIFCQEPLTEGIGEKGAKTIIAGLDALGEGFANYNPFDMAAAVKEADVKIRQETAQARGEAAKDSEDLLASAKELERAMIERMVQLTRSEHESRMSVINHLGT
jgi:hypothetical protein